MREAELALELLGGDARVVNGDQVGGPRPEPQAHCLSTCSFCLDTWYLAPSLGVKIRRGGVFQSPPPLAIQLANR